MAQVKVNEGILEGAVVISELCGQYYSFKGIPYATPPVGRLRFKAPLPPTPWEGIRSAKECGNQCPQYNFITKQHEQGSEDCLYLNVYTPTLKPDKPLTVMIWIHGGAFMCGNGNDTSYDPEFLLRQGVILVTLNYRLEVLGFLCLDTEEIPGNAGAKDQVAAMRWVKQNIANFGGDPENITLFGQSSGAVSISYHCVSPMTKGLFKRAICQSGAITTSWPHSLKSRERAFALAKKLGCQSEDDKEIHEFFLKQPASALLEQQIAVSPAELETDKYEEKYIITSEKVFPNVETFFTGNVRDALKNDIHEGIELIIGYTENDGLIHLTSFIDIRNTVKEANTNKRYFKTKCVEWFCSHDEQEEISKALKEFYTGGKEITIDNLMPIANFHGGYYFKFSSIQFAKYFARKNKVYFYKFTCISERNIFTKILGLTSYVKSSPVCHIDDVPYLFPMKGVNLQLNQATDSFRMVTTMTKLWTNFAKTGNPTPDASLGLSWKPFRSNLQHYANIGNKVTRSLRPDKEEVTFWESLLQKYLPIQVYQED